MTCFLPVCVGPDESSPSAVTVWVIIISVNVFAVGLIAFFVIGYCRKTPSEFSMTSREISGNHVLVASLLMKVLVKLQWTYGIIMIQEFYVKFLSNCRPIFHRSFMPKLPERLIEPRIIDQLRMMIHSALFDLPIHRTYTIPLPLYFSPTW
jgi:hypothetical protein